MCHDLFVYACKAPIFRAPLDRPKSSQFYQFTTKTMPITPPNRKTVRREFSTYTYTRFYTAYNLRNLEEGIKDIIRTINFRGYYNTYKNILRLYRIKGKEANYRPSKHYNS